MKKVIDGLTYNTETATLICDWDNIGYGCDSTTDFAYCSASLYKAPRSGRYFLAGEGGARSMWSQSLGQNSWTGGEGILPLESDNAAFEWLQGLRGPVRAAGESNYGPVEDVIEKHFPHLIAEA